MSTVDYTEFLPEVMQYVPDVFEGQAINAIRQSCIEFCTRTRFLQMDADPIPLIPAVANYEINANSGLKFVDILAAWVDTKMLVPKSVEDLTRIYRWTDWRQLTGSPLYVTQIIPSEIIVVPQPVVSGNYLRVRAAYAPTRASTYVDNSLYEEYLDAIAWGARSRLYGTPKQPFSDPRAELEYAMKFRVAVNEARVRVNRGLTRSTEQIEFQRMM